MKSSGNVLLAYYLNKKTYEKINLIDSITYDDYFMLFSPVVYKDQKFTSDQLSRIIQNTSREYIHDNWQELKELTEEALRDNNFDNITPNQPVLLRHYSLDDNSHSFVLITKNNFADQEKVNVMILNIIRIKKKIVCMSYYCDYSGPKTISSAAAKNDYLLMRIIDENKEL